MNNLPQKDTNKVTEGLNASELHAGPSLGRKIETPIGNEQRLLES